MKKRTYRDTPELVNLSTGHTFYCNRGIGHDDYPCFLCKDFVETYYEVPDDTECISLRVANYPTKQALRVGVYLLEGDWNASHHITRSSFVPTWCVSEYEAVDGEYMYDAMEEWLYDHPSIRDYIHAENRHKARGGEYRRRVCWLYVSVYIHGEKEKEKEEE